MSRTESYRPWDLSTVPACDSELASAFIPSPHHGERVNIGGPDMLLLHYTGMRNGAAALSRLCDIDGIEAPQVSAHYLVFEDGGILQCVSEARRAQHAGVASWAGASDINSCSIGIEIVNPGHDDGYPDFSAVQICAVIELCADILRRHPIKADRILGHSDVAPHRKQDPGEKFPWRTLAASGIGLWIEPAPISAGRGLGPRDVGVAVAQLQTSLASYGYGIDASARYDEKTKEVVAAFQRHFRPARVDGFADPSTIATLSNLIAARSKL